MSLPEVVKDVKSGKNYILVAEWGRGSYGRCFLIRDDASLVFNVLKMVEKGSFNHEVDIHSKLANDHIVQFINAFSYKNMSCLILEPCENGNVELLLNCRKYLTHPEVRCIATQVAHGLEYLHSQLIIHRDIKLSNLLFSQTMTVKIADFGLSYALSHPGEKRLSMCGTEHFMAPEVFSEVGYSFEVDIWALGCVVYTLLDGNPPNMNMKSKTELVKFICSDTPHSRKVGQLAWKFLKTIFTVDPSTRPTAKNVLKHNYFITTFTPERLTPSVFYKKDNKPTVTRRPLTDITNREKGKIHTKPQPGKENIQKNIKRPTEFTMSLRGRKTLKDLPFLENVWIDKGAKLSQRILNELLDIRVLHSDWELDMDCIPFTCISCWVQGISVFGYKTNNGAVGIEFAEGFFFHRSADGKETFFGEYGDHQLKNNPKLERTLRYTDELMKNLSCSGPETNTEESVFILVKKCYLPKEESSGVTPVIGFLLSNGSCQVNFSNHQKLIVNLHEDLVVLWNGDQVKMCKFGDLRLRGIPKSLKTHIDHTCIFLTVSQQQTF